MNQRLAALIGMGLALSSHPNNIFDRKIKYATGRFYIDVFRNKKKKKKGKKNVCKNKN